MFRKLALAIGFCAVAATAAAQEGHTYRFLAFDDGNKVRWDFKNGPRLLTYSFVREYTEVAGSTNCGKLVSMGETMAESDVDFGQAKRETAAAFAMWTEVTGITFKEVDGPADIIIGALAEPIGVAFTNVFYNHRAKGEYKPILRAQICVNPLMIWKVGFPSKPNAYDVRYVMAHEIGHVIGLQHPNDTYGQVMGWKYQERFRTLQAGDIQGAQALYPTAKSAALKGH